VTHDPDREDEKTPRCPKNAGWSPKDDAWEEEVIEKKTKLRAGRVFCEGDGGRVLSPWRGGLREYGRGRSSLATEGRGTIEKGILNPKGGAVSGDLSGRYKFPKGERKGGNHNKSRKRRRGRVKDTGNLY